MDKQSFLLNIDELLELDAGTLTGEERLASLAAWDSLAVIGFIAFIDESFGITLQPAKIAKAATIADLYELVLKPAGV